MTVFSEKNASPWGNFFCDIQKSNGQPAINLLAINKALSKTCFFFICQGDRSYTAKCFVKKNPA